MPQNVEPKPLSMLEDLADEVTKRWERSKSELLPEDAAQNVTESEWRQLFEYGEERAVAKGIGPEDVVRLVEEYRAEVASSRT